ncbi:MAG TPA: sugar-binding domain-containing protein [Vicinamibacteria bacterium]|jgi:exo-1,4-beta-D-glucosaminidase
MTLLARAAAVAVPVALAPLAAAGADAPSRMALRQGWALQSSALVPAKGDAVSREGFKTTGWHEVTVPNTVVGALVANGTYPDPTFGTNLRRLPGANYPLAKNFSHSPMPAGSPFRRSWWYRTEFELPAALAGRTVWLHFDGINYRANVWMNGKKVGADKDVVGAFRRWQFDVSRLARPGARNVVAVEVTAPQVTELAFNWVDWNPMPPDKNMGLWGDVYVTHGGRLALRNPQVVSRLALPGLETADLTVSAEVWNPTDKPARGTVRGSIESIRFEKAVSLVPGERTVVRFTPREVAGLRIMSPRVWWPYRLGAQEMYTLTLEVDAEGTPSDRSEVRFGIQEMASELTAEGHRLFKVNGKPLLLRGGGWASDFMLRRNPEKLEAEIRYVRDMGLNTIRLEGKPESEEFYDLTDRYGILVQTGWCCCDHWEQWENWDGEDHWVAVESQRDQLLRLRNRPSIIAWFNGSDFAPPPDVERRYLDVLAAVEWPKAVVSNARMEWSTAGASGVKMKGPYDYVPPSYWLMDSKAGGAFGFSTEATGGMGVPPLESMREMVGAAHLWPVDRVWIYHAGGQEFAQIKRYTDALEARYGKAQGVLDFTRKAQAMAYEGHRAMFEAFPRNKYKATGVIQWMLNNAWPSVIWHLYDYYLRPAGAYFGTKKAAEPVHIQYSYDDHSVAVVDDTHRGARGLKATATVLDFDLKPRFTKTVDVDLPADGVVRALALPSLPDLTPTYFLRLELADAAGKAVSSNFYWLSTRAEAYEWEKTTWFWTPVTAQADFTALGALPPTTLAVSTRLHTESPSATVTVENTGTALAFQVRLRATAEGREILPVEWEDNYFALMPGEKRELRVAWPIGPRPAAPTVSAEAWNTR